MLAMGRSWAGWAFRASPFDDGHYLFVDHADDQYILVCICDVGLQQN